MENSVETINKIVNAQSIAVVGASANPEKWGYKTLKCLLAGGYDGKIFVVNSKEKDILGITAYPSVDELPEDVELLVILLPAAQVPGVLRQGIRKKAKGAIIITSGFREAGREDLEEEILAAIKGSGLRIIGPNIQGINYIPNKMCAVVLPLIKKLGSIGIISQSGSVSATVSEWAENEGIGISGMINLGNQVDLCETDFLEFFGEDEKTKVIAFYLEGPKDGARFKDTLKRVSGKKPVVILKPGRTAAGKHAAVSHTASVAGDDIIFTHVCKQFGVMRTFDMDSFYDTVKIFAVQPLPRGRRVLVITSSGGAGSLTIDELNAQGLETPLLSAEVLKEISSRGKSDGITYSNPLDIPSFDLSEWSKPLEVMMRNDVADIYLFSIADPITGVEKVIIETMKSINVPVVVSYMGGGRSEIAGREALQNAGIPVYSTPERAARSIGQMVRYAEFRRDEDNVKN